MEEEGGLCACRGMPPLCRWDIPGELREEKMDMIDKLEGKEYNVFG